MRFSNMKTTIYEITEQTIDKAVSLLNASEVVAIPTETVYGLGAVGTDSEAVKKIYQIKGRPSDNPLIAHVHKDYDITRLVYIEQDYVDKLIKAFTPGPLTMVLKSKGVVCKEAVGGGETLAIRFPLHKDCQRLLKALDKPVVAPSANLSKHTSPVTAMHVYNDLNGKLEMILDGGKCSGGIESTVLDCTATVPRILRAGLITKEMIESVVGACEIAEHKESDKVRSPGVKYKHYRPKCETALYEENQIDLASIRYDKESGQGKKAYIMCADKLANAFKGKNLLLLGKTEEQIAFNLYDKLLEGEKIADIIIAIAMPDEKNINLGIMNRMRKSCE